MFRGKLSTEMFPRTVLETIEQTLLSRKPPSSRTSSFSATPSTQHAIPRRRSSIPLFRRRANSLVRLLLVFFAIPLSIYLFATSRTARIRREALLDAFVKDPARVGRWPEWLHVPSTTQAVRRVSPSRRSAGDGVSAWKHWQRDGQVAFWGNVDKVGPSPFDHVPKHLKDNGKRILFLTGKPSPCHPHLP